MSPRAHNIGGGKPATRQGTTMGRKNSIARLLRVKVSDPDLDALLKAVTDRDSEAIAAELDAAVRFEGAVGSVIEIVDGPVFEEVAELIGALIEKGIDHAIDQLEERSGVDLDAAIDQAIAERIAAGRLSRVGMTDGEE